MKLEEVNIRDPYIIKAEGRYYLYGTRSQTCWTHGEGFDCYVSDDLKEWEGPKEIFHRPDGFFANKEYWAPECVYHNGYYYLVATLGSDDVIKGCYALRSARPDGPFEVYSGRLTPQEWDCLDGTVYFDQENTPYLIFSHSFGPECKGEMCAAELTADLSSAVDKPFILFDAADVKWAVPFPYAKAEFGIDGDVYFTDGPCLQIMDDGRLYMTWSSWGKGGYTVGTAVSDSASLRGPWKQCEEPLFPKDGGHGMFFTDYDGNMYYTLHYPNEKLHEHPVFYPVKVENGELKLIK